MTAVRPRVFVSSVMEGYAVHRDAARQGIRQADADPVLAEDFQAQASSPRNACLDGVQSSDALVLLLGARHGWVTPSGRSATEEEYEEAQRRQLPILVFVQDGVVPEPKQRAFVARLEDYISGHFRKSFQAPDDLRRLVREAVMTANLGGGTGLGTGGEKRIREALNRRPENIQNSVWMQTCWATQRNEEVVDPLQLNDASFRQTLQKLAHGCTPPLFHYEMSKKTEPSYRQLRVVQGEARAMPDDHATIVAIRSDGTVTVMQNVSDATSNDLNRAMVAMHRLDPDVVRDRLERSWSFAAAWWNEVDGPLRHDPLLYGVGFYNVGSRSFERVVDHGPGGLTLPGKCPHDPLIVFDQPRQVPRRDLNGSEAEIRRILKTVKLRFREWENNVW